MTRKVVEALDLSRLNDHLEESMLVADSLIDFLENNPPSMNGNGHSNGNGNGHGHVVAEELAPYDNQRMA